jgi:hypothetical protein
MNKSNENALVRIITEPEDSTNLDPGPPARSTTARAALRRCCSAWQRAFNQYLKEEQEAIAREIEKNGVDHDDEDEDEDDSCSLSLVFAARQAAPAYCNAMPVLEGYDGIRDFIACTAQGVLIGAIPPQRSGQLLYAAQVALSTLQAQPKATPTPGTRKTPLLPTGK